MTEQVKRNDPCPCGSGKKFKQCCGKDNIVDFPGNRIQEDLEEIIQEFVYFIYDHYHSQIPDVADVNSGFGIDLKLQENAIFYQAFINNKEMINSFIQKQEKKKTRLSIVSKLRDWKNSIPGLYRYKLSPAKNVVILENVFTGNAHEVIDWTGDLDLIGFDELTHRLGILGKQGDQEVFICTPIPLDSTLAEALHEKIEQNTGVRDFNKLYHEEFLRILSTFKEVILHEFSFTDSLNKEEEAVLDLLLEKGSEELVKEENFSMVAGFWLTYCQKYMPTIRKPAVFAAAIEYYYFNSNYFQQDPTTSVTQKELATRYGVSAASLSKRAFEIDEALHEMAMVGHHCLSFF